MAADVTYQNVVHKRQGGTMWIIPTGCTGTVESGGVFNIASGGAFQIGGTAYVNTAGNVVQQFEILTSANIGETMMNYGVTYIDSLALASTFVLGPGTANVEKKIVSYGLSSAVPTIKSSGCTIYEAASSALTLNTITMSTVIPHAIDMIAVSTTIWVLLNKTTGVTLSTV